MKHGDMVLLPEGSGSFTCALIVREMTFKAYCDKHDELMLEYDINSAWEAWESRGPTYEVLTSDSTLKIVWPDQIESVTSNVFEENNEAG